MKIKTSVKKMCQHCQIIRRRGVVRVICKAKCSTQTEAKIKYG